VDCLNCGKRNPDDARYCVYCGVPLAVELRRGVGTREVTCLSADVKGFTKLDGTVPRLKISELRRNCLEAMERQINHFGGTVVKRYSAGIDAVFGAPVTWERDTELAVLGAIAMTENIAEISEKVFKEHGTALSTRCGIDVGLVKYENAPRESTVTAGGATLEYAARLKTSARPNGVLISHGAYDFVRNYFEFRPYVFTGSDSAEGPVTSYVIQRRKPTGVPTQMFARGPFISREDELKRLMSVINKGLSVPATSTIVIGEPGMGKTRTVAEAVKNAAVKNVFWTRYLPRSNVLPYLPYRQFITDLFDVKPGKELLKNICKLLAENGYDPDQYIAPLGSIFDRDFGGTRVRRRTSEDDKRRLLYDLVLKIAELTAAENPFVFVLENVHWADQASLNLTRFLLQEFKVRGLPIASIITSRDIENSKGITYDDVIYLKPFDTDEIEAVARRIIREENWNETVKQKIINLAHGNPLYAEEFARTIAMTSRGKKPGVPPAVRIGVQARLDRLSDKSLSLIKLAACISESFSVNLLNELSGLATGDYFEGLYELLQEGLIYVHEDKIRIRSPIIGEIVEQELYEGYKVLMHGDIAERLRVRGDDPVKIARHLVSAGRKTEAERYLVKSGDESTGNLAYRDAIRYYLTAADLIGDGRIISSESIHLIQNIVDIYVELGKSNEALTFLKNKFKHTKTAESKAGFLSLLGRVYRSSGSPETALGYFNDAESLYKSLDDRERKADMDVNKGFCDVPLDRLTEAETYAKSSIEFYTEKNDDHGLAESYYLLALIALERGDTRDAIGNINKASVLWEKLGQTMGIISANNLAGTASKERGRVREAIPFIEKNLELAGKLGRSKSHAAVIANYAYLLVYDGKIGQAINMLLNEALPIAREVNDKDVLGAVNGVLSSAYCAARNFEQAIETGRKAFDYAEETGSPRRILEVLQRVYRAKLGAGATDLTWELERLVELGTVWTSRPNLLGSALREINSRLAINLGDPAQVQKALQDERKSRSDKRDVFGKYETRLLLGELEEFISATDAAEADYSYVHSNSRKTGVRYYEGLAAYGLARLKLKTRDKKGARRNVKSLENLFGGQGLEHWEGVIASLKTKIEGD
jgi:class 3 adenylate cyclase/tetratricopeptide (TPR) repeat protein